MSQQPPLLWRFAKASFDETQMLLTVGGIPQRLERKPIEVLRVLLRHANEVVTRDEIHSVVWPGRVLSDNSLMKAISRLREVLRESGAEILTVHGYGYRLVAEVNIQFTAAKPVAQNDALAAGQALPHRSGWQLDMPLAMGGQGLVWRVRHPEDGLQVVKFARNGADLSGLRREITVFRIFDTLLGCDNPMLPVVDYNLDQPPFFIGLRYLAAGNLQDWLDTQPQWRAWPEAQRIALFLRIARLVAVAHGVGVLHKDLKPSNVLIGDDAAPILADFGVAGVLDPRLFDELGLAGVGFTHLANEAISPMYSAPELHRAQPHSMQTDLYALGVMLYQLMVGDLQQPLGSGWEAEIDCPLLRQDLALAVHGDPQRRLKTVAELIERLERLPARREEQAAQDAARDAALAAERKLRNLQVRRRIALAVAGVFLVAALVSSAFAWQAQRAKQAAQRAQQQTQAAMNFMVEDVLGAVSLSEGPVKHLSLNQVVARAAKMVDNRFAANDLEGRARTWAALYQVYGVSDFSTQDPEIDAWMYRQQIDAVRAWFTNDPEAAFDTGLKLVLLADFWDPDDGLDALLDALLRHASTAKDIDVIQRLSLSILDTQRAVQRQNYVLGYQRSNALDGVLQSQWQQLLKRAPYSLVHQINNATRSGLLPQSGFLCAAVFPAGAAAWRLDPSVELDLLEACTVAAVADGRWHSAITLGERGLAMARTHYDDQVSYFPTFNRFVATARAALGDRSAAIAQMRLAEQQRAERKDALLPYVQAALAELLSASDVSAAADWFARAEGGLDDESFALLAADTRAMYAHFLLRQNRVAEAKAQLAQMPKHLAQRLPQRHRYWTRIHLVAAEIAVCEGHAAEALSRWRLARENLAQNPADALGEHTRILRNAIPPTDCEGMRKA